MNALYSLSPRAKRTVATLGVEICTSAYIMCEHRGEGPSTVSAYLDLTTTQANAAIDAGRELHAAYLAAAATDRDVHGMLYAQWAADSV